MGDGCYSEPWSHPWRQQEPPELFFFGVEGLSETLTNHSQIYFLLCFFGGVAFPWELAHFALRFTQSKTAPVSNGNPAGSSQDVLFLCTGCRLGRGAQDIMPVPLGKHIQTMVCVWKGEQINQDWGISQLLFLKKDSIARKQSTHKNNT